MIAYRAIVDVSKELAGYLAGLLAAHRRRLGTRAGRRALSCRLQAVFALVWFRERRNITVLGRGMGISQATAYRYLHEAIDVLAAQAPDLHSALERVRAGGWAYVILDGIVIPIDRLSETTLSARPPRGPRAAAARARAAHQGTRAGSRYEINAWFSGKTRRHGGNVQAVMRPDGFPIWVSDVQPGHVHDLTAARHADAIAALTWAASPAGLNLPTLADNAYRSAGIGIHTPVRPSPPDAALDPDTQTYNQLLRGLRCLGERGFALLTGRWRTLQRVTLSPRRTSKIIQAALVLTHYEHGYTTAY